MTRRSDNPARSKYNYSTIIRPMDHNALMIKTRLATILAGENITIEHRKVSTAFFDLKSRILTLPIWEHADRDVFTMLVLHEVGHALFTEASGWKEACEAGRSSHGGRYPDYLNVVEDARIEKKMIRKYPGGGIDFDDAYAWMHAEDFFKVESTGLDVAGMPFIDRINLYFKGYGEYDDMPFTVAELAFVRRIRDAEEFTEVVEIANELCEFAKAESSASEVGSGSGAPVTTTSEDMEPGDSPATETDGAGPSENDAPGGKGEEGEGEDATNSDKEGESGPVDDAKKAPDGDGSGKDTADKEGGKEEDEAPVGKKTTGGREAGVMTKGELPGSVTNENFTEACKELANTDRNVVETTYATLPDPRAYNLESTVVLFAKIWAEVERENAPGMRNAVSSDWRERLDSAIEKFKKGNLAVVNMMGMEFDRKKAAAAHARAMVSKTGVLNTNKLHEAAFNDDIFLRATTVPTGKSHGLIMFIDWSVSMNRNMRGTIEQALNLILFCKRVGIPFDIYGFSTTYAASCLRIPGDMINGAFIKKGDILPNVKDWSLLHLASSAAKKEEFTNMLRTFMLIRSAYGLKGNKSTGSGNAGPPDALRLGATPLNECIEVAIPLTINFRKRHHLELVSSVFLTDGAGMPIDEIADEDGAVNGTSTYGSNLLVIRDPALNIESSTMEKPETASLLDIYRGRTGAKLINFFVTSMDAPREVKSNIASAAEIKYEYWDHNAKEGPELEALYALAEKDGGVVINDSHCGWDHHFIVVGGSKLAEAGGSSEKLNKKDLRGADREAILDAFENVMNAKKSNRVVLRKFADLVAH